MPPVKLDITADGQKAIDEIKRIDAALSNTAAVGEAAAKQVTYNLKEIESTAGKAGQSAAKLRGILSTVSPALGNVAGFANDAADAVEVFAASEETAALAAAALNPLTLAAVALFGALAFAVYEGVEAQAQHEAAVRANADAIEHAAEVADNARDSISGLAVEWSVATGEMTKASAEYVKGASDVDSKFAESLKLANQNVGSLTAQIATLEAKAARSGGLNSYRDQLAELRPQLEAATENYRDLQDQVAGAKDKVADIVIAHEEERQGAESARKATEDKAAASRAAAEASRLQAAAEARARAEMAAAVQAAAEYRSGLQALEAAGRSASESNLQGVEKEQAARARALEALETDYRAEVERALGNAAALEAVDIAHEQARNEIIWASESRISEIRKKTHEDEVKAIADSVEKTRKAEEEKAQAVVGTLNQAFGVASQLFDLGVGYQTDLLRAMESDLTENEENMTEGQKAELKKRIAAQREAAERSFEIAKAAKIAEATASTALAVINAISQSPPPSPFGLIGAGIAAAAGALSIAQIASQEPSFHIGTSAVGPYSTNAPDEVRATLKRDEAVLTGQGVANNGGRLAIEGRNAGRRDNGGNDYRPYTVQYLHQAFNPFIRDNIRLGGPLADAIDGNKRVGHRNRSYS